MSTKDSHFRRVYPDFFWGIDCIIGQIGLFCAETWYNLTERNVYILGLFFFIFTSMLVRKTWDALHTKNMFAAFLLFIANADKIQKYKNRMIFRDKEASFVNSGQRPQEHFNRHSLPWHPYTLTFDVISYTLKTIKSYFLGLIEYIWVCGPRPGFPFVKRFATTSVLQNIHLV